MYNIQYTNTVPISGALPNLNKIIASGAQPVNNGPYPNTPIGAPGETRIDRGKIMRDNIDQLTDEEIAVCMEDMQFSLDQLESEGLSRHGWEALDLIRSLFEKLSAQSLENN